MLRCRASFLAPFINILLVYLFLIFIVYAIDFIVVIIIIVIRVLMIILLLLTLALLDPLRDQGVFLLISLSYRRRLLSFKFDALKYFIAIPIFAVENSQSTDSFKEKFLEGGLSMRLSGWLLVPDRVSTEVYPFEGFTKRLSQQELK